MRKRAYIFKRKTGGVEIGTTIYAPARIYDKCAIVITDTEDAAHDVLVEADEVLVGGKIMEWDRPICASMVKVGPMSILDVWRASPWIDDSLYTVVYDDCGITVAMGSSLGTVEDDGNVTVYTRLPDDDFNVGVDVAR